MRTVRVTMSDETYTELRQRAKHEKLPGVASLLLRKFDVLSDDALAADITKTAVVKAKRYEINTTFRTKDLFSKEVWLNYSVGVRLRIGRQFQALVESGKYPMIQSAGKDGANHHLYKRIY